MIINLIDKNILKVLALFLISPGSKYLRKEIKEKTEINNVPLDNSLNKLLNFKIINKEKDLLILNFDSKSKELIEEIRKEFIGLNLPLKIYYILLDIIEKISEVSYIKEVYLFGSYAKLIYHENSDIDIAVAFSNKIKNKKKIEKKIDGRIEKISNNQKKSIQMHYFLEKDMKEKDPIIKDIVRNGKRLI